MRDKKKISQKKMPETLEDMVQRIGVLQESMSQDLQTVLEVTVVTDGRLDRLETKVDHLETKVDRLETKVDILEVDMKAVKETVMIIKDDVEVMKYELKKKVDVDEFAALERRVAALEKKASS